MEEDDEADEADECFEDDDDDDLVEDENQDGEEDDGEENAGISIVAEADENGEDYSVYGKVEDEDEEDDDMCFEDIKKIEGGRSNGNNIYVNQSFVSKDALLSELRLTAVRFKFSFRIYKSMKTLLVTTCPVSGCQWKVRASVKHGTNTFWVTKYVEKHTCSVGDRLAQRRHCTPKYVGRLFIDRVEIIDGLNPQHITDAMKNMFCMTLDYTTSYRALLYAQLLITYSLPAEMMQAPDTPPIHVTTDENGEDYSVYGKFEDEDEEEDDMCFEDIKKIEGGRSNGNSIYVNQSFVSEDALLSEQRLTAVRFRFSFRIYKSTKTLLVTTCPVSGCQWKRRHCTPKYVGRLFIDRVVIIDGLNPQHITDAMKNMFGMTLDYTTSYRALLYAQTLVRGSEEDGGSLPAEMMQAPDTPPIHVTSDRQVRNLLEITKMHGVRLCVSSRSKMETVSEFREEDDEADECFEDDDDDLEDDGEEDDGEEDAGISIVAEADENGEDYSVYGNVEDEDEEDDDMCFGDIKKIEGRRSNGNSIYVNQSFVSKDALLSELRLTPVRFMFSFRIYKSTKTLIVTTCAVSGCQWKWETNSLSGDTVLRSMLVGFSLIMLESLMG
ncbi:hypothetical protein F2Q69_00055459 [Brassica cretica]|uniref:Transposase MuDR plant domain-containing protein n=1 Tax=Brassica cretica TaxID=69181 RepID=A0A8S9MZB9_BRACR|nr:hypothetical protein F2Q69_00055459 [Brassica cretica]